MINFRLHNFLTVKLERNNFLLQRQQLISVIIGHGSECFFKKATHLLHNFLLHPIKKLVGFNPAFIYSLVINLFELKSPSCNFKNQGQQ